MKSRVAMIQCPRRFPDRRGGRSMQTVKYVSWQEDGAWLGYIQDYPDYWTQGETLDDLKEHLRDLSADLIGSCQSPRNAKMHRTDLPLTDDEQQEIGNWVTFALRGLGVEAGTEPPDELQNQLRMAIDEFRLWDEDRRVANLEKGSLCIGSLWGQTLCDACGWEWANVSLGSEWEGYGV